ncbi:MAG TPA: SiaB family protein kinase [Bacteroidales bacterium]|nr:SiaB family protein kinase [Bacteroidales bacterium]
MTDISMPFYTNHSALTDFFEFHHLMEKNQIVMTYAGEFSQSLTKTLLSFTEKKFSMEDVEDIVRRKIFNIMVELLQNISKNALDNGPESTEHSPVFMIGESKDCFLLISSNKISNEHIPPLQKRLDQVNSLDTEGLRQLYKQVRMNASFSKVGGAGIGIIDMARKSNHTIDYHFLPVDDHASMFSIQIKISKN